MLCTSLVKKLHTIITEDGKRLTDMDVVKLSCFIFALGEIAIKEFLYLDVTVYKELKRRNYVRETNAKKKKADLNSTRASAALNKSVSKDEPLGPGATNSECTFFTLL